MMQRRDRRRDILRAAEKLFTTRRFHEVTTDDIAREAAVGKGTLYKHFADKDGLFFEVAESGVAELCEELETRVPDDAPFDEQLLKACALVSGFFGRRRQILAAIQSDDGRAPLFEKQSAQKWVERRRCLLTAMAAIIRRGSKEGALRADVEPEVLAAFLLGMLRTRGRNLADAPESSRRLELVVDLFRNGARGR